MGFSSWGKRAGGVQLNSTLKNLSLNASTPLPPLQTRRTCAGKPEPRPLSEPYPTLAPPLGAPGTRCARPSGGGAAQAHCPAAAGYLCSQLQRLRRLILYWCLDSQTLVSSCRFLGPAGSVVAGTGATLGACALTRQPICSPADGL